MESKEQMRYKTGAPRDPDMTVPGTPRTFLLMPRGLKNSAAPTAAHSQSPWPEHCTAWDPARLQSSERPECCEERHRHSPHHPWFWGERITLLLPLKKTSHKDSPSKCWWSDTLSKSEGQCETLVARRL